MAIVRTAGTEIIRTAWFEDIDSTATKLIVGVQHHIYTVLSLIVNVGSTATPGTNRFYLALNGYDAKGGASNQQMVLLKWIMVGNETFVWDNKFSFNGYEPDNSLMSGSLDTAAEQDAIADQGSSVSQYLQMNTTAAADNCEVGITYIDQNNA